VSDWLESLSRLEYGLFCLVVVIVCSIVGLSLVAVIW
jgi:hypothetical protein